MRAESAPLTPVGLLIRAAARAPATHALVAGETRLDYAAYARAVAAFAGVLAQAGANGGRVALLLGNGIALPIALLAAQAAGAAAMPLNPDYTAAELAPMLARADPAVAVVRADLVPVLAAALAPGARTTVLVVPADEGAWAAALATAAAPPLAEPHPDAIGLVQFTGGTSGVPKGACLTNRALATNVWQREQRLPTMWNDERIVCAMPLFHSFASTMGLFFAASSAGTLHILPRYRPDWLLDTIEREAITRLPIGPTIFNSLIAYEGLTRSRLATLRAAYSGSAPLDMTTLARWDAATGVPVYEGYGQTEAGPVLTYHGPQAPSVYGSVGPALADTRLRIVDPETGRARETGEPGEIEAQGPQIMSGYLADPQATAAAFRDCWLRTGDIGRLDAAGNLFIVDRLKDMAIVSGYNVYPREVDAVLAACPGVTEAAAVAAPDAYRGEAIHAFYAGDADVAALAAWCEKLLVKYKRPSTFRPLTALPKTSVGKIDKAALKAMVRELAGVA